MQGGSWNRKKAQGEKNSEISIKLVVCLIAWYWCKFSGFDDCTGYVS